MSAIKIRPVPAILLMMFCLASGAAEASASRLALAPGDQAPRLEGSGTDGVRAIVDFTAHEFTLVNFWASWCEPCKAEMPELERLWQQHREQGFEVVGVFHDSAGNEAMRQFAEDLGVTYTVFHPNRRFLELWGGARVLPLSYLVNGEGKILRRYVGATPEQVEGLVHDIGELLAGRPMGPLVIPQEPAVSDEEAPRP